jgi:hypothetical protein
MVGLAREIQCVAQAGVPDVPPQIPDLDALETPIFLAAADVRPGAGGGVLVAMGPSATKSGRARKTKRKPAGKRGPR